MSLVNTAYSPGGNLAPNMLQICTTAPQLSYLLGDIFLHQAVEGHNPADLQQHRGGGWLLASPAVATATATPAVARVASARPSTHNRLVMAQVAPGWTAALLLAADLHATHHIICEQLSLLQS